MPHGTQAGVAKWRERGPKNEVKLGGWVAFARSRSLSQGQPMRHIKIARGTWRDPSLSSLLYFVTSHPAIWEYHHCFAWFQCLFFWCPCPTNERTCTEPCHNFLHRLLSSRRRLGGAVGRHDWKPLKHFLKKKLKAKFLLHLRLESSPVF
jgi:hypothetical protein